MTTVLSRTAPVAVASAASDDDVVLRVDDLHLRNRLTGADVVSGVSFTLRRGHVVGIVGESGSGKTLTCRALLGILPSVFEVSSGVIDIAGRDAASLTPREWTRLRGTTITAVFQDPGSYLNPSTRVGPQIAEALRVKRGLGRREAKARAIEVLGSVRLRDPETAYTKYPHELSGGMLQRVLLALAVALEPQILIADEVTTALDVTVQAEVLDLLLDLKEQIGLSLIVVSHDLAVIAQTCDDVLVLRDGVVVEHGPTSRILYEPEHPYTRLLIDEHNNYGLDRFLGDAPLVPRVRIDDEIAAVLAEEEVPRGQ